MTGNDVVKLQKKKGITNAKLAEMMDVCERKISILRNRHDDIPKVDELALRAIYFNVDKKKMF